VGDVGRLCGKSDDDACGSSAFECGVRVGPRFDFLLVNLGTIMWSNYTVSGRYYRVNVHKISRELGSALDQPGSRFKPLSGA
jgi:hypothetical protein